MDYSRLQEVEKLCALKAPYAVGKDEDALFIRAMQEIVSWHQENCDFYRDYLNYHAYNPEKIRTVEDCSRIPFLHANFFKTHEVLSIPRDKVASHLTSSGTTGQKSQMFFDERSIKAGTGMIDRIMRQNDFITDEPVNYLLYTYEPFAGGKLGTANTDMYLCNFAPANKVCYALKSTGAGGHEFDLFGVIRALQEYEAEGLPVRIFGFPSFLYFTLQRMQEMGCSKLKLSEKSLTLLGGGWKGYASKQIHKLELYRLCEEMLGIPESRCRDGFGAVEHAVPYIECENHQFHVPVWSRVFIRDVKTLEPLDYGKSGFLSFVTPYITSVPAISVMMGDLAALHSGKTCSCGIETPYFEVQGRAGSSKNKSCALAAAEFLRRQKA